MKEYLLLWSGQMFGMRKAQIPARAKIGICVHYVNGEVFEPDLDAVRESLPFRYRAMFDRATRAIWSDKHAPNGPATLHLCDTRGKYRHTLYMQPLFEVG